MMNSVHNGKSLTLADLPKAIIASIQQNVMPDYSYDKSWVSCCLASGVLPPTSLAGQELEKGGNPFLHCKLGGGLVS